MEVSRKKLKTDNLTDEQMIKLMELKFFEEGLHEKIVDIMVIHRALDKNGFRVFVNYESWAPEETGMILSRLYISQFEYLLNEGIIKIENNN